MPKPAPGAFSVRDRVAALEAQGTKVISTNSKKPEAIKPIPTNFGEKSTVPMIYPLHYKRFLRRTSSGTAMKPDTPFYRSLPDDEPLIHAPRPTKSIPVMRSPPETPTPKKYVANHITPPSFLYGTKSNCVRHGRKQRPQMANGQLAGAKETMVKSRSGAYIPTGLTKMRQMEATSPWVVPSKSLTKPDPTKSVTGSDACPDCVTELNIKRREFQQGIEGTVKRPTNHLQKTTSSVSAEPATSTKHASTISAKSKEVLQGSEDEGLVVCRDLGEDLDAVIFERDGDLRKVILSARNGMPTIETMQRLSKELAQVSNAINFAGVRPNAVVPDAESTARECAVLVEAKQKVRMTRTPSVPELLDMIDQAANEIQASTGKIAEHNSSRRDLTKEPRHSWLSGSDFDEVVGNEQWSSNGLVSRQSLRDECRMLHDHLVNQTYDTTGRHQVSRDIAYPNSTA